SIGSCGLLAPPDPLGAAGALGAGVAAALLSCVPAEAPAVERSRGDDAARAVGSGELTPGCVGPRFAAHFLTSSGPVGPPGLTGFGFFQVSALRWGAPSPPHATILGM